MSIDLWINSTPDTLLLNATDHLLLSLEDTVGGVAVGSYPATPAWASASISSYSPTFTSITHGLMRQTRSRGGHLWRAELYYGGVSRANFSALWAWLNSQRGQAGIFTWSPGAAFATRGTGAGSPFVSGAGQTGSTLLTDGWGVSQTVAKAGDFFQITNDPKVYQLTADATSNSSGDATLSFFPSLRVTPPDGSLLTLAVTFRMTLDADTVAVDWSQCVQAVGFSVGLVEAL